jgi:glutamate 5-kinase
VVKSQYVKSSGLKIIKKEILLKIGTNINQRNQPYFAGKIEDIGMQIAALNDEYEFIIVSSGAIAAETVCKTGK